MLLLPLLLLLLLLQLLLLYAILPCAAHASVIHSAAFC
jgi:hypothetical protein